MQENNEEELAKEYIDNSNFIENKIFTVLNFMKYTLFFETKELNLKNFTNKIAEKIINNKIVKKLIKNNLKKQGKLIKGVIKDIFVTDIIDINDVDFFEVINNKLSVYFFSYLLKIILFAFKENILNSILYTSHLDLIMQNDYFSYLINNIFDNTEFEFNPHLKMNVNANKVTIYNGLEIPKSESCLKILIKYVDENIYVNYLKNEKKLRDKISPEKEEEYIQEYNKNLDRFEENIKVEMNKNDLFKAIYNENNEELKKMFFVDYLKYFIIKYTETKETNYKINQFLLNFLKLIIKIKLSENNNQYYEFDYTKEEFIKIILFTRG